MSVGSVVFIQFVHYLLSFTTVNSKYSLVKKGSAANKLVIIQRNND